ncbi:MAG: sporulation integral membrane protein YlbJ [Syntrophomonadaceae bacterium]|nr:sporulation integral membrane protein YlbJ [Syntrophomonadaceae bacterium]
MRRFSVVFFVIIVLILTVFMIINPQETVKASSNGLKLWLYVVVPALLPFFIAAELLVNLGFISFLGVLLDPVMKPIFRLPGCSSLVVVMGFTSGFPMGAILTRKLLDDKLLTVDEAERLVSFTNNSSPLFILGAVGIGMFGSASLGYLLAVSLYLSNLLVGLMWRFRATEPVSSNKPTYALLKNACQNLLKISSNNAPIGKVLGDAVKNSLNNILAIAGFIILFSVLTRMLTVWGIMDTMAMLLIKILAIFNVSYTIAYGLVMGIFEITIAAQTVALASQGEVLYKLMAVSAILAFSGFSVIAQVMSFLAGTPIRFSFYLLSRLVQIGLSLIITLLGYHFFIVEKQAISSLSIPGYKLIYSFDAWGTSLFCLLLGLGIIAFMMLVSFLVNNR